MYTYVLICMYTYVCMCMSNIYEKYIIIYNTLYFQGINMSRSDDRIPGSGFPQCWGDNAVV